MRSKSEHGRNGAKTLSSRRVQVSSADERGNCCHKWMNFESEVLTQIHAAVEVRDLFAVTVEHQSVPL